MKNASGDKGKAQEVSVAGSADKPYTPKKHKPKYRKIPHCIYFYYIGDDHAGARPFRRYYYPSVDGEIREEHLSGLIRDLAVNARSDGNDPPKDGTDGKNIVWTRKGYLVFLIDDPQVVFDSEGIVFLPGSNNNTLYDAKNIEVDISDAGDQSRMVSCVYCINHMKRNKAGDDLEYEVKKVPFKLRTIPPLVAPVVPDDGGTNLGPPVPPP